MDRNERRKLARRRAAARKRGRAGKYKRMAEQRKKGSVSVAEVRAEGVIVSGHVSGTSVLYVLTERGLRLFHAECLRIMTVAA